jgi:hypothetical protein
MTMTPNKSPEATRVGRFFFIHKVFGFCESQVAGASAFIVRRLNLCSVYQPSEQHWSSAL